MNELTNNEIDMIVKSAEENRNTRDTDLLNLKENMQVNESAELEKDTKIDSLEDGINLATEVVDSMPDADVSLFDLDGDQIKKENIEISDEELASIAKDNFDLNDDEAIAMLTAISELKKNPNYPIYNDLPEKIKKMIKELMIKNGIPAIQTNNVARMVMMEFLSDSEVDSIFIDLEKAINEALNIPSILDLYTEHTNNVMKETIPKMIEDIKDTEPEKAELLSRVKDSFDRSFDLSFAINSYNNNSRIRKCVRKHDKNFKRALDEFNYKNEKSNFKMNDVTELPAVLYNILIKEPASIVETYSKDGAEVPNYIQKAFDLKITESDVNKFCILICRSCDDLNPKDVADASYMYYMMKNIIVLKHTREAKTDFAAELISNICDAITFIRNKEAETNAHMDKS